MAKFIKSILLLTLLVLPFLLSAVFYCLDKVYFLCPLPYAWDMMIRNDSRGEGFYAATRNGGRMHNGIDLLAKMDTPVMAARCGKASVLEQKNGMGNYVIIRHTYDLSTLYGHLSKVEAKDGSWVRQGEVIGRVGKTGNANHPDMQSHLHFEVRKDNIIENPMDYLE